MKKLFFLSLLMLIILFFIINCGKTKYQFKIIFVGSAECHACNEMKGTLNQISNEYKNKVKIEFYDIESKEGHSIYREYKGKSIPLTVYFNNKGKKFFIANSKIEKDALIAILKVEGLK